MSETVNLPALGESVTEGTVTRWLKNVGDRVEIDEPLLEVSTDKVDTEIPSPVAGTIEEILIAEDETIEVGTALVRIGDGAGDTGGPDGQSSQAEPDATSANAAQSESTLEHPDASGAFPNDSDLSSDLPSTDAAAQDETAGDEPTPPSPVDVIEPVSAEPIAPLEPERSLPDDIPAPVAAVPDELAPVVTETGGGHAGTRYVTPIVRKLAHELGVDLALVSGSGVGGRIRKEDVVARAETTTSAAGAAQSTEAAHVSAVRREPEVSSLRGTTVPMSRLRKVIAERAVASMQASAQLTSVVEVDVTRVATMRDASKAAFLEKTGVKLSFLPFFALAAAEALKAYPIVNATIDGDSIVYPAHENLSIAVDTERGLLTPVIRDAAELTIADLAKQIADLATRTRDNQLKPDELAGGTFTLTNTGSRGALFDTPVVFLPQSAILGTGIVSKKPAVVQVDGVDAIAIRSTVYLALSYDHRIVDGADAARFLVAVKARLEDGDFSNDLGI